MKKWIDKAGRMRLGSKVGGTASIIIKEEKGEHFNDEDNFVTTYVVLPPDKGWGWVVVAATFFYAAVYDGILFNFGQTYLDSLSKEFGSSQEAIALVIALFQASQQILGPVASALTNRYGFQRVSIFGSVLCCVSSGVCYFAMSTLYLWVFYGIIGGIGSGMIFMASNLCVSFYFQRWRPLAVCLSSCGSQVGGMLLGPAFNFIQSNYGWRMTMLFQSGLFFICAIMGVVYRPIKPIKITKEIDKDKESVFEYAATRNATLLSFNSPEGSNIGIGMEAGLLGLANRYYPTAADLILRESELSFLSRNPSFASDQATRMGATSQTNTNAALDLIAPVVDWQRQSESETSMRIVVGQDLQNVQSYWRKQDELRFTWFRKVLCRGKFCFCLRNDDHVGVRPLYRDDIFFDGSVAGLPHAQLGNIGLNLAVTRVTTQRDIDEEKSSKCICCPVAVRRTLATMLSLSLFKSPTFLLYIASCSVFQFGFVIPLIFLTDQAKKKGLDSDMISLYIPTISASALVTKILLGIVTSLPKVSLVLLVNCIMTVGGFSVIAIGFTSSAIYQLVCCIIFGIAMATFFSLRSLIVVQLLGLENLTNAFGLVLMFSGIMTVLSPPLTGWFRSLTNYDAVFWLSGGLILLSVFFMYPITWVNNRERRKMRMSNETLVSVRDRKNVERKKKGVKLPEDV